MRSGGARGSSWSSRSYSQMAHGLKRIGLPGPQADFDDTTSTDLAENVIVDTPGLLTPKTFKVYDIIDLECII